jgi:universal stress protein A
MSEKTPNTGGSGAVVPSPIRLQHILVPVDFSPSAHKAFHYAVSFAGQYKARLTIVHVVEPPMYPTELGYVPVEIESLNKATRALAEQKLNDAVAEHVPPTVQSQAIIRMGHPYQEITQAAKELAVDLIVISTHGYTGLKHVLLGSTAERIVRHAPCPVLTVRAVEHDFV